MTAVVLRPRPLPLDRVQPSVGLLVLVLHAALLWLATLYWPVQNVVLGAVQDAVQIITVQIFQKTTEPRKPPTQDIAATNANPFAISSPGSQRFGRSEAMLALPAVPLERSTPLATTAQIARPTATRGLPSAATTATTAVTTAPSAAPPISSTPAAPQAQPKPVLQAAPDQQAAPSATPRIAEEKLLPTATAPSQVTNPSIAALERPLQPAQTPPPTVAAPTPTPTPALSPAPPPSIATAPAVTNSPQTPVTAAPISSASSNAATATLASGPSPAASGLGGSTSGTLPGLSSGDTGANTGGSAASGAATGAPLNLTLPPRSVYRPPLAVPQRSLAELANDQLRRRPRDAFADSIDRASHIDCLKDAPDGTLQGLLAIGPLLKRAIEEKCRK